MACRSAALCSKRLVARVSYVQQVSRGEANETADLIFRKLGVVHVLWNGETRCQLLRPSMNRKGERDSETGVGMSHFVPMLLHAALRSRWKSPRNLTPATACVSQSFQSLLFGRGPRRVCPSLLDDRALLLAMRRPQSQIHLRPWRA